MKLSKRILKTNHTRKKQPRRQQDNRTIIQTKNEEPIKKKKAQEIEDDNHDDSFNNSFVEIEIEPSEYYVDQRLPNGIVSNFEPLKNEEDLKYLSSSNGSLNSSNCAIQQHNEMKEQTNQENEHETDHELQELFAVRTAIQDQTLISSEQQQILINLLICPLCLDAFKEPVYLKSCLHRICKDCIEKVIRLAIIKRCPVCRQEIGTRRLVREDDFLRQMMKIVVGDVKQFNEDIDEIKAKQVDCINQGKLKQQDKGIEGKGIIKQELNIDRSNDNLNCTRLTKLEVKSKEEADSITGRLLLRRRRQVQENDKLDIQRNQLNEIVCEDNKMRNTMDDRKQCKKESQDRNENENKEGDNNKNNNNENEGILTRRNTRNNNHNMKFQSSGINGNIQKDSISQDSEITKKQQCNGNIPKSESCYNQKINKSLKRVTRSNSNKICFDKTTIKNNQSYQEKQRNNQSNKNVQRIKKGRIQKKTRESLRIQQIQFNLAGIGRTLDGKIQRRSSKILLNSQQKLLQLSNIKQQ